MLIELFCLTPRRNSKCQTFQTPISYSVIAGPCPPHLDLRPPIVCFFFRSRIYRFCVALLRLIRFDVIRFVSKSFLLSQINTSNQFMDADIQTTIVAGSTIEIDLWRSSIDCSIIRLLFAL